ncbi:alpha/beta hydrolase [Gemmiger sp. An87]|uniref:alpha/beta fold hydrolase n=1 Tax=unclassified Allofournierella TaxID=2633662 RepID=UPI000B3AA0E4|nr:MULTISPECIES: alpha/beta hydrolase [unclassified Fournierella]MDY4166953.1 alpha/beta hydrolase [Fournierella sp.]OUN16274.1 alpha/beta hydrolase [Gemmiger sp. An87]
MYAIVNGLKLFYHKEGSGRPVILLHGNGEDHTIFDVAIKDLARSYTVYALDSRSHGKSDPVPTLTYREMAEDVAAFIRQQGLEKPALVGFSDGGVVALLVALRWPDLPGRLVVAGANMTPAGIKQPWRTLMRVQNRISPDPKLDLMLTQPHLAGWQLTGITAPTLVLAGEKDLIDETQTRRIARSIPGAKLLILPGETHGSYVVHSDKLYPAMANFLRG